ncbi:HEAT repeat domain-containing protein [Nodularia spumigena CS-591/12]|uniref:HEAT repeat domain-containing protein n=1 Tax=Nodularia spumigena TaxID=70799 RepID=UPI00232B5BA4|nr:HEAT repeat domain-containing protein [Nodularia spumigena]MDB9303080.1 HEAT repeat domain-containing protein [Nodularia spumigena CS-591/12]
MVKFEDGCNSQSQIANWKGFYEYRAYFLAAAGIAEFKDCGLADVIVQQIVKWDFGDFNIQTQVEINARAVLLETDHKKAITALVELIHVAKSESTRWVAARSLGKVAANNPTAIAALVELIRDSKYESTRRKAASSLGKIAANNPTANAALVELIRDSQSEDTRMQAASSLGKIAANNPTAITALVELIRDSQSEDTRMQAAKSLVKIAANNPTAITALVELIRDSQDEFNHWQAASSLQRLLTESENMAAVVTTLKDHLSKEAYKVIWHCAQTMTYPAFYQAWHS